MKRIVTCPICGKEFETVSPNKIYCSRQCYYKSKNRRHYRSCQNCGKPCSFQAKLCQSCHFSLVRTQPGLNPNWRGGRRKTSQGYIKLYKPGYPRAVLGYVLEHIYVWEQTHNQQLPDNWVVHHINGIRDDNRPENLMAMPRKSHATNILNKVLQKRIRTLEAENQQLKASSLLPMFPKPAPARAKPIMR